MDSKLAELLVLREILDDLRVDEDYYQFIIKNYNIDKINERYLSLGKEYLQKYALK